MTNYKNFPRGIATDDFFCNREKERAILKKNIQAGQHSLIIAPRRYGKTSLAKEVLKESRIIFSEIDLFTVTSSEHTQAIILKAVENILSQISNKSENLLNSLKKILQSFSLRWMVGFQDINISLVPLKQAECIQNIFDVLKIVDDLLVQKNMNAAFFIDEIQEISNLKDGQAIEGVIRNFAQSSQKLSFIFSGSRRHLLQSMFHDKSRPLYRLCETLNLNRISSADYKKHLNMHAQRKWSQDFDEGSLQLILSLTQNHSYYVNCLCNKLWSFCDSLPNQNDIRLHWKDLMDESHSDIASSVYNLTSAQKNLLIHIANGVNQHLTAQSSLSDLRLSSSTVISSLNTLSDLDYIEKIDEHTYRLVDPIMNSLLQNVI